MGSGNKKKKGAIDMGSPGFNKEDWEAWQWCIRNKIEIAPKAKSNTAWWISITNKGKTNISPEAYEKTIIWQKIFEYCRYYYEKYRE